MGDGDPSRRSFLGKLLSGTVVAGFASAVAGAVAYLLPSEEVSSSLGPRRRRVAKADEIPLHGGTLVPVDDEPVWVIRTANGIVALSAFCTHKGCVVRWTDERRLLICPCHNGEFDERGNVVRGMPLAALPRYQVAVIGSDVYVWRERRAGA
jgi:cytochrome b6-f complex iron-sulfur subunit